MKDLEAKCIHACKNTCASLNEALRKEAATVRYYEEVLEECNIPDVSSFMSEMIEEKRQMILKIVQKLNEIHARSNVIDGIMASFNYKGS